jgi:hypothetical protein
MTEKHIHIHIPSDAGTVHIVVTGDEVAITTDGDPGGTPEGDDALESMIRRFEGYDSLTGAREILEAMQARGWEAFVPQPRAGATTSEAAYVRFVFHGARRKATLYIDSAAIFAAGKNEMSVLAEISVAEVRSGSVRVNHSGDRGGTVADAMAAAGLIEDWANEK